MINAKDSQNTFYILDKKTDVPIVFIHGVGLNHKIWEPQINVFENTFTVSVSELNIKIAVIINNNNDILKIKL